MSNHILTQISDGRTDLVIDYLAAGHAATSADRNGVPLIQSKAETPLHRAAAFGTEDTIQMLLDASAAIDAKDINGDSPLSWASWYGRPDSVLRKLCYGQFQIRPNRRSMAAYLLGDPHV
jgi:ankyrin repeat protein